MVRVFSLMLVFIMSLSIVACGSEDEDEEPSVANADSCEELVDAFMPIMQGVLDAVSEMSMEEIMASEEEPEILGEFEEDLDAVEEKSNELDCQDDELQALLEDRIDELTASGPVGELVLQMIREEGFD